MFYLYDLKINKEIKIIRFIFKINFYFEFAVAK